MPSAEVRSRPANGHRPTAARDQLWPSFSIVIPTFQRRDTVCECVRSLRELNYAGTLEIIVVVDGSTDGTVDALRRLGSPFPLRIIETDNGGGARARNIGATAATGEILFFLDDDMLAQSDLLEHHARNYRNQVDAVTGDVFLDPSSPQNFITESVARWISLPRPSAATLPFHIYTGHLSVRRAVFEQIGGFDEGFTSRSVFGHEDTDFGVKLLAHYRARHEPRAITRQKYLIGPRESMARAPLAAAADLRFSTRYPHLAEHIFEQRGCTHWKTRFLIWPISRIPFAARILSPLAVFVAERGLRSPFRSNRLLCHFFFAARSIAYWSALWAQGGIPLSQSLLILCYHAIEDQSGDPVLADYGVAPAVFAEQLDSLARRGFVFIGPEALAAFVQHKARLPRRAVLLTFDDGYHHLVDVARNVLRPRGIDAIAFAVTAMPSRTNEWDQAEGARALRLLGKEELRALSALGVEIGAHSRTHRPMTQLTDEERIAEAAGPREDLAEYGLPPARFFAYPYGASDPPSRRTVQEAGYLAAFNVSFAYATEASDPFLLPRVPVLASDTGWRFRLKTGSPRLFEFLAVNMRRTAKILGLAASSRLA